MMPTLNDPPPAEDPVPVTACRPVTAPPVAEAAPQTVTDLLTIAAAQHAAYREAMTRYASADARTALQAAYDARTAAQALDPTFSDHAWAEFDGRHPHVALLHFYREQLAK